MWLFVEFFLGVFIVIGLLDIYRDRPVNLTKVYFVCGAVIFYLVSVAFAVGFWLGSYAY